MGWSTGRQSSVSVGSLDARSRIDKLIHFQPDAGEELRADDITSGDLYIGAAPDGTATSAASWDVVRMYRTTTGAPTRVRLRENIVWDDRTVGW